MSPGANPHLRTSFRITADKCSRREFECYAEGVGVRGSGLEVGLKGGSTSKEKAIAGVVSGLGLYSGFSLGNLRGLRVRFDFFAAIMLVLRVDLTASRALTAPLAPDLGGKPA